MSPPDEPAPGHAQTTASSLLSRAGIGVARVAASGEIASANDAFCQLTAYPRASLRGEPLATVLGTFPPALQAALADDAPGDEPLALTIPVETGDGEVVAYESLFETIPAADGSGTEIVAMLYRGADKGSQLDPADESGPSDELAPAKAFVALADALSEGIIVLDTASEIQYANPAVERILGYSPAELVGGSKLSIIPERLRDTHLNALNRYLETGQRNIDWEYVELPGQHKDGHEVPLGISLNDFFFGGDRYFVGLFRDITARKAAERELRERERLLEQYREYTDDVLDAIEDMFYVLDEAGNLQRWNHTLCEVTGYPDAAIGSMHALAFFPDDERDSIAAAIADGFETGHTRVEADLLTEDGDRVPYEFVASTLENPDGDAVLAGIGRDVSEQEEQRRELEASNERLEQFAYAASHDLKEPLRMVSSYLTLIDDRYGETLDSDAEEFLEYAIDGAERMQEMIDALLQYSRVESQGEPMGPVDLNAVVEDITDDLQLRIEESDATIRVGDLPTVVGDGGQLRQVFQNLLNNAIEYSGDEPPRVEISAEKLGSEWQIAVDDEGLGIDPEETDRVFQVFQRLHSHDEHPGTGLGLALCQRIVERHGVRASAASSSSAGSQSESAGGDIWVESEPGEGSTFYFTLPVRDEA